MFEACLFKECYQHFHQLIILLHNKIPQGPRLKVHEWTTPSDLWQTFKFNWFIDFKPKKNGMSLDVYLFFSRISKWCEILYEKVVSKLQYFSVDSKCLLWQMLLHDDVSEIVPGDSWRWQIIEVHRFHLHFSSYSRAFMDGPIQDLRIIDSLSIPDSSSHAWL
jgi:hypothetical protein